MRIGFIGTGNFARQHAKVLCELEVKIVGCFGTNLEKTASFSNDFNCKVYTDPTELITAKKIDALYIVIPPFAHDGKFELRAINAGIPFLCEKPVGLDLSICEKISKKIQETGLITSSGYLLRYEPLFTEVKKIIKRNKISTIRICSYSYMPEVKWWRQTKLSGGMMIESGSHYLDLLRYIFGEIKTVAAINTCGIAEKNFAECDIYDSMEALLKFNSGIIGSIGITHLLNKIQARNDQLEVYGENFALKIDLYKLRHKNEASVTYKEHDDRWQTISYMSSKKDLLDKESIAFLSAIKNSNASLIQSTYPDALQSLRVASAMEQSAQLEKYILV